MQKKRIRSAKAEQVLVSVCACMRGKAFIYQLTPISLPILRYSAEVLPEALA